MMGHKIVTKHLAILSSLVMKKCWDLFLAKNLASTSFYYLGAINNVCLQVGRVPQRLNSLISFEINFIFTP